MNHYATTRSARFTKIVGTLTLVAGLLGLLPAAHADGSLSTDGVPRFIPYRGVLEQNGTVYDGQIDMQFDLFDGAASNTPVWSEVQTVTVYAGEFQVLLGASSAASVQNLDLAFSTADDMYLGITLDPSGTPAVLTNKQRFLPVPFSYWTETATDMTVGGSLNAASATVSGTTTLNGATTINDPLEVTDQTTLRGLTYIRNKVFISMTDAHDVWIQGGFADSGDQRNLAMVGFDENNGDYLAINWNGEYQGGTRLQGNTTATGTFTTSSTANLDGTTNLNGTTNVNDRLRVTSDDPNWDVYIQGGTATSGDNRNLALLGRDEDSGDYLVINYNSEYANGTRVQSDLSVSGVLRAGFVSKRCSNTQNCLCDGGRTAISGGGFCATDMRINRPYTTSIASGCTFPPGPGPSGCPLPDGWRVTCASGNPSWVWVNCARIAID